ncbi:immediate early response gene 5-like protein [Mizuhopecten yessoensis]|uniref:Immediate early response gene 5 protein n=1 Tax=Mizuhopecten yessoensis TaxID=6573 RepID=A0A210PIH7_MIZYE|nr:immediate early response gene 5-like protein [Mizuhopecten yessoensis]OWF36285.1 Immediate early response gene 5 protein [Mizuhopecten yessoensis]
MNSEAQRLITVSLGKIQASRSQRGGINLHKNLLVACVLHKARTAYMMDNLQTMLINRRAQSESKPVESPVTQISTNSSSCITNTTSVVVRASHDATKRSREETEPCTTEACREQNKENSPPKRLRVESSDITEQKLSSDSSCSKSKPSDYKKSCSLVTVRASNTPVTPSQCTEQPKVTDAYVNSQSCVGCVKRRRFSTDSSTTEEAHEGVKRPRIERVIDTSDDVTDSDNVFMPDPQTDIHSRGEAVESSLPNQDTLHSVVQHLQPESIQITNLVTIFNTGFGGLCEKNLSDNVEQIVDCNNNNEKSQDKRDTVTYYNNVHGHKFSVLDSCSTQVIDSTKVDSVPMPTAIAV